MSYLERRNRKDSKGLTPEQLRRRHPELYEPRGTLDALRPIATLVIRPDGSAEILKLWPDEGPPDAEL